MKNKQKNERVVLLRDSLSSQLFSITTIPLNYAVRKSNGGCIFKKSQEKRNYILYTDDRSIFSRIKKIKIPDIKIISLDISREFGD